MLISIIDWLRMSVAPNYGGAHMREREKKAPLVLLAGGKGRGVDGKSDTGTIPNLARTGDRLLRRACTCHAFPGALCLACSGFASYGRLVDQRRATWGGAA